MASRPIDPVEKVRLAGEAIDAWPPGGDARRAAALLHSLWPSAPLAACVLASAAGASASVWDGAGRPRPEWEASIREEGLRPTTERAAMPTALGLAGRVLVWGGVCFRDRVHGALALSVAEGDESERGTAHDFLAAVGRLIAGRLEVEALEQERNSLAEEAAGSARLADIGEAAGSIAHEFNNLLNALLLHVAVLELKLPPETHPGLHEVRRQATEAAALIHHFQNYRRRPRAAPHQGAAGEGKGPTDLNRVVRSAAVGLIGATAVRLDLEGGELPITNPYDDLKRLCQFLLRNAAGAAAATGGGVVARTSRAGGRITLRIEDEGPPLSPEAAAQLFEPSAPARDGTNSLELAACRALARRLQAVVRGEPRPEGGAAFVVEWPSEITR